MLQKGKYAKKIKLKIFQKSNSEIFIKSLYMIIISFLYIILENIIRKFLKKKNNITKKNGSFY